MVEPGFEPTIITHLLRYVDDDFCLIQGHNISCWICSEKVALLGGRGGLKLGRQAILNPRDGGANLGGGDIYGMLSLNKYSLRPYYMLAGHTMLLCIGWGGKASVKR